MRSATFSASVLALGRSIAGCLLDCILNESPGCLILIRHVEPEKPERLDSFHYIRTLAKVDQLARPGANANLVKRSFRFFKAPVRLPLRLSKRMRGTSVLCSAFQVPTFFSIRSEACS